MSEIVPAILPKTYAELEEKVGLVRGLVDSVQVDICDGKFVPNTTWPFVKLPTTHYQLPTTGDPDLAELLAEKKCLPYWDELDYEFDLMVAEPQEVIADFVRLGASRVIVHVEAFASENTPPPHFSEKVGGAPLARGDGREALSEFIHEWKDAVELGLALNPSTPLSAVETFLHEVRLVQCMGNDRLGFQGTPLDGARVLPKIAELRKRHPALDISIDIGVNFETAPLLIAAGANRLVAGSAVFGSGNVKDAIRRFKDLLS